MTMQCPRRMHLQTPRKTTRSRQILAALPALATPTSSHRVYLEISVAGRPRGRVVLRLDPTLAPVSTATVEALATGTLRRRSGRTAGYRYSQASVFFPCFKCRGKVKTKAVRPNANAV